MLCYEQLPCRSWYWPHFMHRRQICSFGGSASRRIALSCVSYSAAPPAPNAEPRAPPLPDDPQNDLLSLRQLVRTYAARSGGHRQYASAATSATGTELLPAELWESARLSKLAGICYWPQQQLAERLRSEGMELVAQGSNYFTSWYVCDADSRWSRSAPAADAADRGASSSSTMHAQPAPAAERRRLVLLRGMTWSAPDVDAVRVWSMLARASPNRTTHTQAQYTAVSRCQLRLGLLHHKPMVAAQMRAWPTPFMERGTPEPGELLAHAGIAAMAGEMYDALLPHLVTAVPVHLTIAGEVCAHLMFTHTILQLQLHCAAAAWEQLGGL